MTTELLAVLAVSVVQASLGATAEEVRPQRIITVAGEAIEYTVPDTVVWSLTFTDNNKNLGNAKKQNDEKVSSVLGLVASLGIETKDIQTGKLDIEREYEYDENDNPTTFKYFTVSRKVTVRLRDVGQFDKFLGELIARTEVEVNYSLESTDLNDVRRKAVLSAVRDARAKAEAISEVLGVTLGQVLHVQEYNASSSDWVGFSWDSRPGQFSPYSIGDSPSVSLTAPLQSPGSTKSEPAAHIAEAPTATLAVGAIPVAAAIGVTFEIK